jgi:hypothetical protein
MENINFTKLLHESPINSLSSSFHSKLCQKVKKEFNDFEQKLFLTGFHVYLNYHSTKDFVIDIDDIWNFLGFSSKFAAVRLLTNSFNNGIDYIDDSQKDKIHSNIVNHEKQSTFSGGHNIKKYYLNCYSFKLFCIKARTEKASIIHNYYVKLENIFYETFEEETGELKALVMTQEDKKKKRIEEILIDQFPINTECIYFGIISNTNEHGETLVKFGHTNDLKSRVQCHHKDYDSFYLTDAFRVVNKVEVENLIKSHPRIKPQIRKIQVNGKNKTELIAYSQQFTIDTLSKIIKEIIEHQTFNIQNFKRLLKRNEILEQELCDFNDENTSLKSEIQELKKQLEEKSDQVMIKEQIIKELETKNSELNHIIETNLTLHEQDFNNELLPQNEMTEIFNKFIDEQCIVRTDVDERSVHLEGRFRIWKQEKPKKEVLKQFKHYLGVRFKATKKNGHHGFHGVKLREMKYELPLERNNITRFISHACTFSDTARVLNSTILTEYQKWKTELNIPISDDDMNDLKAFLDSSKYTLKAVVHTQIGSNEGYYGIEMKAQGYSPKYKSTPGKRVYKREVGTNFLIKEWDSIADAAEHEGIHKTAMSRITRSETPKGDYYYSLK